MDTSWISRKASELVPVRRRPAWQSALMWLAAGMAIAAAAGLFVDRGRRHTAVDRAMAAGRDVTQWSGKKARHMRNKAVGALAEVRRASSEGGG